jgi:hypothetical protein
MRIAVLVRCGPTEQRIGGLKTMSQESDKAWFDMLLPKKTKSGADTIEAAPEHEVLTMLSFTLVIDHVAPDKWQATIRESGSGRVVWKSTKWSVREHAVHSAMHMVASGKIFAKEVEDRD